MGEMICFWMALGGIQDDRKKKCELKFPSRNSSHEAFQQRGVDFMIPAATQRAKICTFDTKPTEKPETIAFTTYQQPSWWYQRSSVLWFVATDRFFLFHEAMFCGVFQLEGRLTRTHQESGGVILLWAVPHSQPRLLLPFCLFPCIRPVSSL